MRVRANKQAKPVHKPFKVVLDRKHQNVKKQYERLNGRMSLSAEKSTLESGFRKDNLFSYNHLNGILFDIPFLMVAVNER